MFTCCVREHFVEVSQHIPLEPVLRLVRKVDYLRDLDLLAEQPVVNIFERTLELGFPLVPKELPLIKLSLLIRLSMHQLLCDYSAALGRVRIPHVLLFLL
jgi:hypothetical protein